MNNLAMEMRSIGILILMPNITARADKIFSQELENSKHVRS